MQTQNTKDNKTTHAHDTKHDKTKLDSENYNNTTNNYNPYIQSHTNTSLQNNIPHPKYTLNIQIHLLQNNIHVSKVHCGSVFEPGASPHLCSFLLYLAR